MINSHSESCDIFIAALIKARKEFKPLIFDKEGARNKYVSLGVIIDSTKEALMNNGFEIFFSEYKDADGSFMLETKLVHISNQWKRTFAPIIIDPNVKICAQQQYGFGLSYAKRYSLQTILSVYGDDDDWDNIDTNKHREYKDSQNLKYNLTSEQVKKIIDGYSADTIKKIKETLKINDLREMSIDYYNKLMDKE